MSGTNIFQSSFLFYKLLHYGSQVYKCNHTCALYQCTCFKTKRLGSALVWLHHYLHRSVSRGNSKPIRKAESRGLEFSLETDSAVTNSR